MRKDYRILLLSLTATAAFAVAPTVRAAEPDVNDTFVKGEMYLWNRLADFLEILRCGAAVGPAVGGEIAFTEYAQIGAYYSNEDAISFPHFFPPLWIVPSLEEEEILRKHEGIYSTRCIGLRRLETTVLNEHRFRRAPRDIRLQLAPGIFHIYANLSAEESKDFLAGIIGMDPNRDDEHLDPNTRREPARQLGRGLCNVFTGFFEIPKNMHRIKKERGDFAGATTGFAIGLFRTAIRECTGLIEVVTFPMGWQPIVEPEFPFQPGTSTTWKVNQPDFNKNY